MKQTDQTKPFKQPAWAQRMFERNKPRASRAYTMAELEVQYIAYITSKAKGRPGG